MKIAELNSHSKFNSMAGELAEYEDDYSLHSFPHLLPQYSVFTLKLYSSLHSMKQSVQYLSYFNCLCYPPAIDVLLLLLL